MSMHKKCAPPSAAIDRLVRSSPVMAQLAAALIFLLASPHAQALPSYARQTGQECAACHNGFPELTPYGRLFKLNGYTFTGGTSELPPVAAMMVGSFTHTQKDQAGGAAPHYGPNDNADFQFMSLFYGGAIAPNIGGFIQGTYDNIGRHVTWDNTDIRYANTVTMMDRELVFGVSLNNNPTVTDVWNTTPAWGYPWLSSELAPHPAVATLIEGGFAQQVVGANVYAYWNRLIYAEIGDYRTLSKRTDTTLGAVSDGSSIKGLAPYWRFAVEPKWGQHSLEIGTFGMATSLNPGRVTGFGTDHTVDVGVDAQYQFLADRNSVSLQASWITENDSFTASQAIGNSSNGRDHLRSFHIKSSYYYDQTYGGSAAYFRVNGSGDVNLYSGLPSINNSPNTTGWIGELDYFPFNHGGPEFWPWMNLKLGLQYVYYSKVNGAGSNFDGAGANASDNNTLFLFAWLAF